MKRVRQGHSTKMHRASNASSSAHGNGGNGGGGPNRPAASVPPAQQQQPTPLDNGVVDGHVCPFCGLVRDITEDFDATSPCPRCTLADTPTTRNATKARIGPWHVRQMRNPWAPGMRWETLLALIKRGQVTRDSVVRGPTTHQLWKRACEVKGLSREFGVCYSCGGDLDVAANLCAHCNRLQEPPANPNVLVETRELAAGQSGGGEAADESPTSASRGSAKSTRGHRDDIDDSAHAMDVGASTPNIADPDDMLTVDDAEAAAAFARSVTSRGPQRQQPRSGGSQSEASAPASASAKREQPKKPSRSEPVDEEPPPPVAPRPITLRPRQPGADDALLTPQELAAAFQLNFTPPPNVAGAGGGSPRGSAAGAAGVDRPRPPRRKRSKRSLLFGLFLLAVAAGGAVMYLRPDVREQAVTWSQDTIASAKQFIDSRTTPARPPARPVPPTLDASPATRPAAVVAQAPTPAPAPSPSAAATPAASITTPATRPAPTATLSPAPVRPGPIAISPAPPPRTRTVAVDNLEPAPSSETSKSLQPPPEPTPTTTLETPTPPPTRIAATTISDGSAVTSSSKTTSRPPVAPPGPAPAPQSPPPVEIINIEPPPASAATTAVAKPAPAPAPAPAASANKTSPTTRKVWTNITEAEDEARRLWRLAIDAEQNQDFVEAVALYEQIKQLPSTVHPAGLEVRLSLAKKLTK